MIDYLIGWISSAFFGKKPDESKWSPGWYIVFALMLLGSVYIIIAL